MTAVSPRFTRRAVRASAISAAVIATAAVCVSACGNAGESRSATGTESRSGGRPGPPSPGEGQGAAGGTAVALVPHERLPGLFPEFDGWSRTPPTSSAITLPAPASHATSAYTRGAARIDLQVTDTGGHAELVKTLGGIAGSSFSQTAANGYMKGTTFGGFPAVESWNHVDKLGEISILVEGRFIVHASGTGIDGVATLQQVLERMDFRRLASMR